MKLQQLLNNNPQNENKLERFEQEFISINKNYDTPFHQFKHCTVSLHPQSKSPNPRPSSLTKFLIVLPLLFYRLVSSQLFENIGTIKYNIVQFSNKHTFKFFNNKVKPISKAYFFGDSNNP